MTVDIQISGQGLTIDDKLDDFVTKKVANLERYLSDIQEARVDLHHSKTARDANDRFAAQITIRGKGFVLRAEERKDNIRSAFDSSIEKIQRRIENYKGKRSQVRAGRASIASDDVEAMEAENDKGGVGEIVRRKKFELAPMDEYEALEQMRLLGHEDFFVFFNVATNSVSVLYQRRDQSYGLIDTEML
jgi:putative sigma-54 modulation protein